MQSTHGRKLRVGGGCIGGSGDLQQRPLSTSLLHLALAQAKAQEGAAEVPLPEVNSSFLLFTRDDKTNSPFPHISRQLLLHDTQSIHPLARSPAHGAEISVT